MIGKNNLIATFRQGRVSRRDALAGLAGMGVTGAAATTLLETSQARADEPRRGGYMRVGSTESHAGDTLDPTKVVSNIDNIRSGLLYNRLIDYLPGQGLVGNLATAWEADAGATVWTFELKQDVEFHNGKTMTAADVAYSLNRHLDPNGGSPANAYLGDVGSIETDGDRHVVFNLTAPNGDIPYLLTEYHMTIQPEGMVAEDYSRGEAVGTGPWRVAKFEPGVAAVFERNPNYHRSGLPYIDEIETFGVPDPGARVNALLSGEIELITRLDPQLVHTVKEAANARVLNQPGASHASFPMHSEIAPYTDNDVRLALKHAVDRERMLELAFGGLGTVGRDHPIPQHDPFFAPDVETLPYDPDKVAYYLRKAGMENHTFELITSDACPGGANASEVMAQLMNEAGANVAVKKVPADGYWSAVWLTAPWCASGWYGRPTADLMLSVAYISGGTWNESHWSNEDFDRLVLQARQEPDEGVRAEIYRDIQIMMRDQGPFVIPIFNNWLDAYSTKVRNLKGHPHGFAGAIYWEDVWLNDGSA